MILGNPTETTMAAMRSGRATIGEPRKSDDPERTRDQKRRSNSSANADPEPIGDRTRTEEPGLATNRLKANSSARASRMRPQNGKRQWRPLILVATSGGPTMLARIGVMLALNRHVERVFNLERKDRHWGRRKLARDA